MHMHSMVNIQNNPFKEIIKHCCKHCDFQSQTCGTRILAMSSRFSFGSIFVSTIPVKLGLNF